MRRRKFQFLQHITFIILCVIPQFSFCQDLNIMPLGNSLTEGIYCTNGTVTNCVPQAIDSTILGYRYQLYKLLQNSGFDFDFVGNEVDGCTKYDFPDCNHAGYIGILSSALANKLSENNQYLLNVNQPDVILLEIGTNDVYYGSTSIAGVTSILNEIDTYETTSGKSVLVFLSKIIRFTEGTYNEGLVSIFNTNLWNLYVTRKNAGDLIEWLDIGTELDNRLVSNGGDMNDELHPGQDGYDKMATEWYEAIDAINNRPVASTIPEQFTEQGTDFTAINLDDYIDDVEDEDQYITWTVESTPVHLNVTINEDREALISPKNPDWIGTENITLKATDRGNVITALKRSVSVEIICTVEDSNNPPYLVIIGEMNAYVGDYFELELSVYDEDEGDELTLTDQFIPGWLCFNSIDSIIYGIPESIHIGNNMVTMRMDDNKTIVDTSFTIIVHPKTALIESSDPASGIEIYPNPTNDQITIEGLDYFNEPVLFKMYSLTGIPVVIKNMGYTNTCMLNLKEYHLSAGIYIYEIISSSDTIRGKIMITREYIME